MAPRRQRRQSLRTELNYTLAWYIRRFKFITYIIATALMYCLLRQLLPEMYCQILFWTTLALGIPLGQFPGWARLLVPRVFQALAREFIANSDGQSEGEDEMNQ